MSRFQLKFLLDLLYVFLMLYVTNLHLFYESETDYWKLKTCFLRKRDYVRTPGINFYILHLFAIYERRCWPCAMFCIAALILLNKAFNPQIINILLIFITNSRDLSYSTFIKSHIYHISV